MYLAKNSPESRQRAHELIDGLSQDKAWTLEVKPYRKKRANAQNRYYWGVVVATIRDETGNDANDIHEALLGEYAGWVEAQVLGKRKLKPARRSHDMTVEEFVDYCEWCRAYAARELGLHIDSPGEGT